ncbi:MAG: phage portal protein, partial [Bradyrhizobium sp.]|nr:phage portal protein [Bradyrhizobium sp.]
IILTVNIALRRSVSQLQYFTEGTVPAAFANVPAGWSPQQIAQFQEYWDTLIEGNQARKRQVIFGPDGSKMTMMREAPLQDVFDEWLARIVCFCFSLPPTAFVKQINRATAQQQQESGLQEGLGPFKGWVKEVIDGLIQNQLGQPQLEFRWQDQAPVDPQIQATVLTSYQKQGNYSVNDVREKLGEDPIAEDWANAYVIITASGATPLEDLIEQSAVKTEQAKNPPEPPPMNGVQPGKPGVPAPAGTATPGKPPGTGHPARAQQRRRVHAARKEERWRRTVMRASTRKRRRGRRAAWSRRRSWSSCSPRSTARSRSSSPATSASSSTAGRGVCAPRVRASCGG